MKTRKQKKHVGPGKAAVSLYMDQSEHLESQARAKELDMSLSKYVTRLIRREIRESREGEPFVIEPHEKPSKQ